MTLRLERIQPRTIIRDGQAYVDEPIYIRPKQGCELVPDDEGAIAERKAFVELVADKVAENLLRAGAAVPCIYADPKAVVKQDIVTMLTAGPQGGFGMRQPILVGYKHVRLKWMRPDGKGGVVPR